MKRFWALFFALVLCVALPASAAGEATTETAAGGATTTTCDPEDVAVPNVPVSRGGLGEVTTESENSEIEAYDVAVSTSFSLNTGKSWTESFTTDVIFSEDHSAFKTVITNFSGGSYRYMVEGSDGYAYESAEKSTGAAFITANAKSGVTYTVYIMNLGLREISGAVTISGCCVS